MSRIKVGDEVLYVGGGTRFFEQCIVKVLVVNELSEIVEGYFVDDSIPYTMSFDIDSVIPMIS
jgi:hypothetical protein